MDRPNDNDLLVARDLGALEAKDRAKDQALTDIKTAVDSLTTALNSFISGLTASCAGKHGALDVKLGLVEKKLETFNWRRATVLLTTGVMLGVVLAKNPEVLAYLKSALQLMGVTA
jgi:hypothetical protein